MHKTKPKMFKIRSSNNAKKYGVAAVSLKELIKKGCHLLKASSIGVNICLYEDGTVVTEDYFQNLPDNTELVLLSKGENWNYGCELSISIRSGIHRFTLLTSIRSLPTDIYTWILIVDMFTVNCLLCSMHVNAFSVFLYVLNLGIHVRFKTKSAYMKYNCESRIRGYLKEVDGQTKVISNANTKNEYKKVAKMLAEKLKAERYNGAYFDRSEKDVHRLCTEEGWFSCQGAYDVKECTYLHSINPYGNRESRIIFSTWNLDHIIEKKRTVIPTLVEALKKKNSSEINLDYFYKLLFTKENLKLVHIVCHKKGAHELHCDLQKTYKRATLCFKFANALIVNLSLT
ncbi:DNA fragmentation factor subunit beta [Triplophysa tibetana]|uniref:DNA fragmentation factor subunit beta n=1 Tax=Triplophysa tibetana TaxID=1572043 RepID=A0A5A9P0C6_9TELE|nr:DNA fragmentation factor subunit beta [Triplophysa tibetana]